mmetsp:Transcript_113930/g.318287  ORF Transcript_113930/g.318287 Transcript_113930/m.318287 type:complete len:430 (-) Transcript_113930:93-1382(-)
MLGSPEMAARSRYNASFRSNIFEPLPSAQNDAFIPAGKRRDQTTSEMFGDYDEKDLRSMPKTFIPKDDYTSARQKKHNFLRSEVLPHSEYMMSHQMRYDDSEVPRRPQKAWMDEDEEEQVDTNLRRQMELQSKLFGRPTPAADMEQLHDRSTRLTPNDFKWHNHPEQHAHEDMSHNDRAYKEKCSQIFDYRSPQTLQSHLDTQRREKEQDREGDAKRRADAHYSDLFGRSAYTQPHEQSGDRRPRIQGSAEDKLTVHQDWTDSKTELLHRGEPRPEHPLLRKGDELYQTRIFGPRSDVWTASTERPDSVTHDNSMKLRSAVGRSPQEIHQAHLRSSVTDDTFYEQAESSKHWEVVELHISGLGINADDDYVRNLCQGFDLQIVKATAEVDPVRNLCKGRAKIMVRYNPMRESVSGLVQKLEASRLRVDM